MLVKKITYTDFNDIERTEDFYFNLTNAEVTEWLTTSGNYTLDKVVGQMIKAEKVGDIMGLFKDLIYKSYGEKSLDGKRFIKSPEVKEAFMESEAYSVLFMELISDPKKAADFLNAIVPKDLSKAVEDVMNNPENLPPELKDYAPAIKEVKEATNDNKPSLAVVE